MNRKFSTTELINGTMLAYLRITKDYAVSPDDRAFMIHGTKAHANLQAYDDEFSLLEEKLEGPDTPVTGIFDVFESENGKTVLADYKTSGSFKVAKALGFWVDVEETGEVYKSGKRKGEKKTRKVLKRDDEHVDRRDWELQENMYRIGMEARDFQVDELRIQCVVRDGNTWIARSRGVYRNLYYFRINILPDAEVHTYFNRKRQLLLRALAQGSWTRPCTAEENWNGIRCRRYCEVAEFCPLGKYLKKEKEAEDIMPIRNLSDKRQIPRQGKVRLGRKKRSERTGKEYPEEVSYFILDPSTPDPEERQRLIDQFHEVYGEEPKQITIMLPVADMEVSFPQYYKSYTKSGALRCKGDGDEATCTSEDFAKDLESIGMTDMGLPRVRCLGEDCIHFKAKPKRCSIVATLRFLLEEIDGYGIWEIPTGSKVSIINVNSALAHIQLLAGRYHMIPLTLERRETIIQHEGKGMKHWPLYIPTAVNMDTIKPYIGIDPRAMLFQLPEVAESREDIIFETTPEQTIHNGRPTARQPEPPPTEEEGPECRECGRQLTKDPTGGEGLFCFNRGCPACFIDAQGQSPPGDGPTEEDERKCHECGMELKPGPDDPGLCCPNPDCFYLDDPLPPLVVGLAKRMGTDLITLMDFVTERWAKAEDMSDGLHAALGDRVAFTLLQGEFEGWLLQRESEDSKATKESEKPSEPPPQEPPTQNGETLKSLMKDVAAILEVDKVDLGKFMDSQGTPGQQVLRLRYVKHDPESGSRVLLAELQEWENEQVDQQAEENGNGVPFGDELPGMPPERDQRPE